MTLAFEGHVTADDRARDPYLELPFEVGAGAVRISVGYRHDAGSVLDLGLLDPSVGPFPSATGLRGWSGGARDHVEVGLDRATPGYLPGPLPSGTWRVLLGLAAVAPGGCSYRVEVEVDVEVDEAAEAREGPTHDGRARPAADHASPAHGAHHTGPRWYRGDLQSHTHHSDARGSLEDLRSAALARGLEYLAVTDHNTVSHHAPIDRFATDALLWLPSTEVTTYRGHANVWGVDGAVDFRVRSDADVAALVAHVHARGGLFSVNHPKAAPGCIGCDWEYPIPTDLDALEAWQGPWAYRNWESLERYDRLLRAGRRVTLVGGSDRHQPPGPDTDPEPLRVGSPTTWLQLAARTRADALAALREGRATVSEGPEGPFLEIEVSGSGMGSIVAAAPTLRCRARIRGARGERLRWIGADGPIREVAIDDDAFEDACSLAAGGAFVRAEVVADASLDARRAALRSSGAERRRAAGIEETAVFARPYRLALSNPVYVR